MPRQRTFDHDEAYRLFTEYKWGPTRLARKYGVSIGALSNILANYTSRRLDREEAPHVAFRKRVEANIWHLIDFKRAGFKYGHGELRNPPGEVAGARFRSADLAFTVTGSSAAMCAEIAG